MGEAPPTLVWKSVHTVLIHNTNLGLDLSVRPALARVFSVGEEQRQVDMWTGGGRDGNAKPLISRLTALRPERQGPPPTQISFFQWHILSSR